MKKKQLSKEGFVSVKKWVGFVVYTSINDQGKRVWCLQWKLMKETALYF